MPVYFIRPIGMDGPVKIGCARVPPERLLQLTVWSPFPLEIAASTPGGIPVERRLHTHFAATHSHKEWFFASDELDDLIRRLSAGEALASIIDMDGPAPGLPRRRAKSNVRQRAQYRLKLRHAFRPKVGMCVPPDVEEIMWLWETKDITPSAAQFARLDGAIATSAHERIAA